MSFVRVCDLADVPADEGLRVEIDGVEPIAIFNVGGEVFAVQDQCPHGEWSLAESYVDGYQVECSLHMARFCLRTGEVCAPPAVHALRTYEVRLEGSDVLINTAATAD